MWALVSGFLLLSNQIPDNSLDWCLLLLHWVFPSVLSEVSVESVFRLSVRGYPRFSLRFVRMSFPDGQQRIPLFLYCSLPTCDPVSWPAGCVLSVVWIVLSPATMSSLYSHQPSLPVGQRPLTAAWSLILFFVTCVMRFYSVLILGSGVICHLFLILRFSAFFSPGFLVGNVYEALISTIQIPVCVAAWLVYWFKGFSLWDLTCVFRSIKLNECGHAGCSVRCSVIQTDPQISLHSVGTKGRLWIV